MFTVIIKCYTFTEEIVLMTHVIQLVIIETTIYTLKTVN